MDEMEIVQHPQIDGLHMFFDTLDYRTPHFHREFELLWIFDGEMEIRGEAIHAKAAAGDMLLFPPHLIHEFHKLNKACTFLCVQIAPGLLERAFSSVGNIRFPDIALRPYLKAETFRDVQGMLLSMFRCYLEQTEGYEFYCTGQIHLLFSRFVSELPYRIISQEELAEQSRRQGRLQRLLKFVDENYMNKIRLTDFAALERRSVSHMSHFISQTMQQSFQEYVNTVRFRSACKLIASGRQRMMDVCVESGFSDYRYFSKTFQKKLGMTPEEYSRQVKHISVDEGTHHGLYSLERFYNTQESLKMLREYEKNCR